MFEGIYEFSEKQNRYVKLNMAEVAALPQAVRDDLNLIHKKWGQKRFLSMRLVSWLDNDGVRVNKILMELGTLDNKDNLKDCNKIYFDFSQFAYLCEIMKSGELRANVERASEKLRADANMAYKDAVAEAERNGTEKPRKENFRPHYDQSPVYIEYGGSKFKEESRILKIYTGTGPDGKRNENIVFEAASGEGKVYGKGAIKPSGKMNKVIVGFTDRELGEAGMAGLRAIKIIDLWSAFGKLNENAALLNPKVEKDDEASQERRVARMNMQQKGSSQRQNNRGFAASGAFYQDGAKNYGYM